MPYSEDVSIRSQAIGYLYVVWWQYKFYLRQNLIGQIARYGVIGLLAFEILGPLTHLVPIGTKENSRAEYLLISFLFGCACVVVWHHTRLHKHVQRHRVVLSSTRVLLEQQSLIQERAKPRGEMGRKQDVVNILDAFVFALEDYYPKQKFAASVMLLEPNAKHFVLYAQDPRAPFEEKATLDNVTSVAGSVRSDKPGTLLYVPRTSCIHALRIASDGFDHTHYRRAAIIPNAFQSLPIDPELLKCLLCVRIPLRDPRRSAILSFSSGKADIMGRLEFDAIKVAAALIATALS